MDGTFTKINFWSCEGGAKKCIVSEKNMIFVRKREALSIVTTF